MGKVLLLTFLVYMLFLFMANVNIRTYFLIVTHSLLMSVCDQNQL